MKRPYQAALICGVVLSTQTLIAPRASAFVPMGFPDFTDDESLSPELVGWSLFFFFSHMAGFVDEDDFSGTLDEVKVLAPGEGAVAAGIAPVPGTALWHTKYDEPDGFLGGIGAGFEFPGFRGASIDFSFQAGELEGGFSTTPVAGGPLFRGEADFDREIWDVGLTVPLVSWFYARAEYYNQSDDVDWTYPDASVEKQAYKSQGVKVGIGAKHDIPLGDSGFTVLLNAFAGAVYFDFEHEERTLSVTTESDGWGYVLRGGAAVSYPITSNLRAVGGARYEFMHLDGDYIELDSYSLSVGLGVSGSF